ncbi:RecX family transcriptional regulator [Acetobacteraceae bacterium H6797]|nr:RecX family transcriptional regulator [Acetobacteraceae bacterium H6797]
MSESKRPARRAIPAGPAPTETSLREAALAHIARFAATESGLRAVLRRRVDRWALRARDEGMAEEQIARARAEGRRAADAVAARMTELGAINDQAFAESRARRLRRAGRSSQAIAAHLAAKGVARDLVDPALDAAPGEELDAAIAFLRRRRAGPFGDTPVEEMEPQARQKLLAAMGRAGFEHETARRALDLSREEAEERLIAARGA